MLPATEDRVPLHSDAEINRSIAAATERSLAYFAVHPDEIPRRLAELDREWDIERALEANAAAFGFVGVLLGALVDRRWLALPGLVSAFLLQHATQGWCPPLPALRRLGLRTAGEIAVERYGLKFLRGDFRELVSTDRALEAGDGAPRLLNALHA